MLKMIKQMYCSNHLDNLRGLLPIKQEGMLLLKLIIVSIFVCIQSHAESQSVY